MNNGFVKSTEGKIGADVALRRPPTALIGVGESESAVLYSLGIKTVFDLAVSPVFESARQIAAAAADPLSTLAQFGAAPSNTLSPAGMATGIDEVAAGGLDMLVAFAGGGAAADAQSALGVASICDLAAWPPYLAARTLFDEAFGDPAPAPEDSGTPADLLPRNGDYPTERVYYSTLLIDHVQAQPTKDMETSGPIDLSDVEDRYGFDRPAEGALLSYSQSWYGQGLALGQLLHSLALAPGEATRVAMLDWSRRTKGQRSETGEQVEDLVNSTTHTRALSEVTQAVAQESQEGFSRSNASAQSYQRGTASGGLTDWPSMLDFLNPFQKTPGVKLESISSGQASNSSTASSFSTSSGRREVNAFMAQNIADATHQAAHAARSRRATVVEEVSESESARASTRVVANYNHMHALTVSYYEVVQLFKVQVALEKVEKCLFVPLKLLDFQSADSLTDQQRATLSRQALESGAAKALMGEPGLVAVALAQNPSTDVRPQPQLAGPAILPTNAAMAEAFGDKGRLIPDRGVVVPGEALLTKIGTVGMPAGSEVVLTTRKGDIQAYPIGADGSITFLDPMSWEGVTNVAVRGSEDIPTDAAISLEISAKAELNKKVSLSTFLKKTVPAGQASTVATTASTGSAGANVLLAEHLRRNRLYYNQALWRSLDVATLALLLSPYKYRGKPLLEIIDATPVSVVGNYLIFRMPVDPSGDDDDDGAGEHWAAWLRKHGLMNDGGVSLGPVRQDLVPLPSGGVFAEAVLGRSNSAELLDITRFWNWQDSPIPLQPTEIVPVSTESRGRPADLKPGEFTGPLVNIVSPTTLPDPQGMAAVLSAISTGNMFRDMSGLAATIGLAGQSLQSTSGQAQQAAVQAGQNMKTAADFIAAIAAIAASAITGMPVSPPGQSNASAGGGAVNLGKKMDQAAQQVDKSGNTALQTPSGGSSSGGLPSNGAVPKPGFEAQAFDSFVGGGGSSTRIGALLRLLMGALPPDGGTGTTTVPALKLGEKIPNKSETAVVGAISGKIVRNTPEFDALVKNTNDKIVFKNEEGSDTDQMMTTRLRDGLNELADLVEQEWPGKKLRVTEAWDESNEHSAMSTHYEGRAADITVSDVDSAKLGRLAQLAVDAGLDWVFYENSVHVHVSVIK